MSGINLKLAELVAKGKVGESILAHIARTLVEISLSLKTIAAAQNKDEE